MIKYNVKVYPNGSKYWYLNEELHREDGPAIECADGDQYWYLNEELHRKDGPAVEYADGEKYWYLNGECHREDGPAIEYSNGDKRWYLNGAKLTEEEWKKRVKKIKEIQETSSCDGKTVTIDGIEYYLKKA